jgi:hypothetical protein
MQFVRRTAIRYKTENPIEKKTLRGQKTNLCYGGKTQIFGEKLQCCYGKNTAMKEVY